MAYRIQAQHDGYRRARCVWGRQPVTMRDDELTDGQLDALMADPRITITWLEDDTASQTGDDDPQDETKPASKTKTKAPKTKTAKGKGKGTA